MTKRRKKVGNCLRCDTKIYISDECGPDDAMEANIRGHYGSRNDCHEFKAYICDDCVPLVTKFVTNYAYAPGVKTKPLTKAQYQRECERSVKEMQKRGWM